MKALELPDDSPFDYGLLAGLSNLTMVDLDRLTTPATNWPEEIKLR